MIKEVFTPVYMGKPNSFEEFDENDAEQVRLKALLESVTEKPLNHGKILRFRFKNNYGASVVTHAFSFGKIDQWELAVIYYTTGLPDQDGDFVIAYDTPVTDCVIGYLAWNDVEKLLGDIQAFPPRSEPPPTRSEFVRMLVKESKKYDIPPRRTLDELTAYPPASLPKPSIESRFKPVEWPNDAFSKNKIHKMIRILEDFSEIDDVMPFKKPTETDNDQNV